MQTPLIFSANVKVLFVRLSDDNFWMDSIKCGTGIHAPSRMNCHNLSEP